MSPPVNAPVTHDLARPSGRSRPLRRPPFARPGRSRALLSSLAAALLPLAAACADDASVADAPDLEVTIDTVSGAPRVTSRGKPPAWSLERGPVVGSMASMGEPAPDEFGRVGGVGIGPDGRLYVADAFAQEIRVFDRDGAHVATWGRPGEGPGEFGGLRNFAWMGDTLLVLDFMVGRVAELDPEGRWLGQRPAAGRVTGAPTLIRLYPVAPGEVVQWTLLPGGPSGSQRAWIVHRGARLDTVAQPSVSPPAPSMVVCDRPDGAISFFESPFGGQVLIHPATGGATWTAWSAEYRLVMLGPAGDTLRIVERPWSPVPVTDEAWREGIAEFEAFREEWPGASCEPRGFTRPDHQPALTTLMVDGTGRVWVEAVTPEGPRWEVFDAEGRLQATLPTFSWSERTVPWLGAEEIAWVSADSLGVQRVHRARIVR